MTEKYHAIRIYELLKQYEGIGERMLSVGDLRAYCGVSPDDYQFFKDFRVWVIDVAQREVNGKTDIAFTYEPIKAGRKVVSLRFVIAKNQREEHPDDIRDDPKLSRLVSRLMAHGLAEEVARGYVRDKPADLIEWATDEIARRLRAKGGKDKIANPAGWLRQAIDEDWRLQKTIFDAEREKAEADLRARQARAKELEARLSAIKKAHSSYATATLRDYIERLDETTLATLEQPFRAHLAATWPFAVKKFEGKSSWYADPFIRIQAFKYLPEHCLDFHILPIVDFARQKGMGDFEEIERELKSVTN